MDDLLTPQVLQDAHHLGDIEHLGVIVQLVGPHEAHKVSVESILEHEVHVLPLFKGVEAPDDTWMIEGSQHLGLISDLFGVWLDLNIAD